MGLAEDGDRHGMQQSPCSNSNNLQLVNNRSSHHSVLTSLLALHRESRCLAADIVGVTTDVMATSLTKPSAKSHVVTTTVTGGSDGGGR